MKVLLFDNYDSFSWNIVELLRSFDLEVEICKNDEQWSDDFDAAILSPGPNIPQESGRLMEFINETVGKKSILGICLGHQALALHFGGELYNMEEPLHGEEETVIVEHSEGLFRNLPKEFKIGLYHSWCVAEGKLPKDLIVSARSSQGLIMALENVELGVYGVQFHPESFISEYGKEIMKNFLELC